MTESPLIDSGLVVPVFSLGDDLISCLNEAMAFLTDIASSRFPSTNNQLRTSCNPRNQATIQDGRVKDIWLGNALSLRDQGMQHDLGVLDGQAVQSIIPNNAAFQTEDLYAYDSDYVDISNAKAVLMANISTMVLILFQRDIDFGRRMFKLVLYPLAPKLLQNKEARIDYLKYTLVQDDILQGIVKQAKARQPLDNALDFAYAKADIGIFVGYTPIKKAFRIYNKRAQKILETIHVTFNELTSMASEQFSSGPGLHSLTLATSSSGLVSNIVSQQPYILTNRDDWDRLFQPMFDEYFNSPTIVVSPVSVVVAPIAVDLADSPVSALIDQDAPSTSISLTQEQEHSLNISQGFEESQKTPIFRDDLLHESLHEDLTSQASSSNVRQTHTPFEHLGGWTKDHPITNVIGDPSRSVYTRKQL
nr:hypothetical protein [Tanacetum cinerariifolium]